MAEDSTKVTCTNFCGFSVSGTPEYCKNMYDKHAHQDHPSSLEETHWYEYVFSFWGVMAVIILCVTAVSIVTKTA